MSDYPDELLAEIAKVTNRRARLVLDHILKHGSITTEQLRDDYGYDHPPRAARDVRELGIPLRTERVAGSEGRSIARYKIDVAEYEKRRSGGGSGRRPLPAKLKNQLTNASEFRCEICRHTFGEPRDLQVDHRVPYEVGGDPPLTELDAFMLVCPSCNRQKSWRCEHCPNWEQRAVETCKTCFWANPAEYQHVATEHGRVVSVSFSGEDGDALYKTLDEESRELGVSLEEHIKEILSRET